MTKPFLMIAAFFGGTGVMLGAFGAHGLRGRVAEKLLEAFKTGVHYQLVHALALLLVALMIQHWGPRTALVSCGVLFAVGVLLFSGSLYGLALGGPRWLGPVTPLGGTAMIGGWVALFVAALHLPR
ncbi:DUF423 domain-containing protein [Microbulbifer sediminum]|uniref:DUF423 domain-containing protein n=1 Tax=Microbulbifer sediminum TaxID=2904250 RepID=UPI001F2C91D4|nr:DUF423 domain-containing protein [Microbulbifer sediminum]